MGAALTVQQMLRRMLYMQDEEQASSFSTVLLDELHAVLARRRWLGLGRVAADPKPDHLVQLVPAPAEDDPSARHEPKLDDVLVEARKARLVALCLSGGGIRSASFNLGVLQRLAGYGLLRHVDYLSTVSGGGYIGSWLTSLLQREVRRDVAAAAKAAVADAPTAADEHPEPQSTRPHEPFRDFEDRLGWSADDPRSQESRSVGEHPAITELRGLSNFLTPKLGVFSADTWALFATYVRNATLNQLVLILFLGTLLLIPRLLAGLLGDPSTRLTTALAAASAALFVYAAIRFGPSFVRAGYSQDAKDGKRSLDTFGVFRRVVGPAVVIGIFSAAIPDVFEMSPYPLSYVWGGSAAAGVLVSVLFWLIAWLAARLYLGKEYRLVAT